MYFSVDFKRHVIVNVAEEIQALRDNIDKGIDSSMSRR